VCWNITNRDILDILDSDFENVESIMNKYADFGAFERYLEEHQSNRTGQQSSERAAASSERPDS